MKGDDISYWHCNAQKQAYVSCSRARKNARVHSPIIIFIYCISLEIKKKQVKVDTT